MPLIRRLLLTLNELCLVAIDGVRLLEIVFVMLTEQRDRPLRMPLRPQREQLIGVQEVLRQGEGVIFPVHHRPVQGSRGSYRVTMRHGVSRIRSGERCTLGIIFHDAA